MPSWSGFVRDAPDFAAAAERLLRGDDGLPIAFLATATRGASPWPGVPDFPLLDRARALGVLGARPSARHEGGTAALVRRRRAMSAVVTAVACSSGHTMQKPTQDIIRLLARLGVEGDVHLGQTVKHRSRVARDPTQPNLRQVHLIHAELHDELRNLGFDIAAGELGENVTTRGIDLLGLPTAARLRLGATAVIEITGLRNPCKQLDRLKPQLMAALLGRDVNGKLVRKAGVMGVVLEGGEIRPGDAIGIELPAGAPRALAPV